MSWLWFDGYVITPASSVVQLNLGAIALQCLPFALYAAAGAATLNARTRVLWVTLSASTVFALCRWIPRYELQVGTTLLALAYYAALGLAIPSIQPAVADGTVRKDALFCLLFTGFVLLPAGFFPLFSGVPMLVLGWYMALSAYSYCLDVIPHQRLRRGACLFFLMVDPTLVYPRRASPSDKPARPLRPLMRAVSGALIMTCGEYALRVLPAVALALREPDESLGAYATEALLALYVFVAIYWVRSGFASVQIGLTRALGYDVGECFLQPYLATSPSDFWRRWNVYVGQWAVRHIFIPLSRYFLKRRRTSTWMVEREGTSSSGRAAVAMDAFAIGLTFVCIGVLHDALTFAGERKLSTSYLRVFLFAGGALLVWELARTLGRKMAHGADPLWLRGASVLCMLHYWAAIVVISGSIG